MHHIGRHDCLLEVLGGQCAQVGHFVRVDGHLRRVATVVDIGSADEREILLVGNGEDDTAVAVLEDVSIVVVKQLRHDDVATLHQPHGSPRFGVEGLLDEALRPGARSIHYGAGVHGSLDAIGRLQRGLPT